MTQTEIIGGIILIIPIIISFITIAKHMKEPLEKLESKLNNNYKELTIVMNGLKEVVILLKAELQGLQDQRKASKKQLDDHDNKIDSLDKKVIEHELKLEAITEQIKNEIKGINGGSK